MNNVFIGIDVHQKQSYYCALDKRGSCFGHESISTDRKSLKDLVKRYGAAGDVRVAVETGGSTWWVAGALKESGADVHAVNTYELKLIAHSKRKTDKYDSKILADLLRCNGLPERVHMPNEATMRLRNILRTRKWLVRQRAQAITRAKAVLRHVRTSTKSRMFHTESSWQATFDRHPDLEMLIRPIYEMWTVSSKQLKEIEYLLEALLPTNEERMAILLSIPGIGPVTAWTLIACAALRSSHPGTAYMKKFFYRIMHKKCSQVAIVALAKKLLVISYYMLKQRTLFAIDRHKAVAA